MLLFPSTSPHRNVVANDPNFSLVKIDGVKTREAARFYLGKCIAYVYKAKTEKNGSKTRTIWGKICRTHGNSGLVRAQFKPHLPGQSLGQPLRVYLFPSSI